MNEDFTDLLNAVHKIVLIDRKVQEERRLRGEKFNIFAVLGLSSEEVRLHSCFLAELLNPKGAHGMKDVFLEAFRKEVNLADFDIITSECEVEIEYYIGNVTETRGGRIDILITSTKAAIIIENKIYAGDQPNQLQRYKNFGDTKYGSGKFKLLYLTLDGHSASPDSTGNDNAGEDYYSCISYQKEITEWLETCAQLAYKQPPVRECIIQYQTLIKKLTHQEMEEDYKKKIIEEISCKREKIIAAANIHECYVESVNQIINTQFIPKLQSQLPDSFVINKEKDLYSSSLSQGFYINPPLWNAFRIRFEFEYSWCNTLIVGILSKPDKKDDIGAERILQINNIFGYKHNSVWHCYKILERYQSWNEQIFAQMLNSEFDLYRYLVERVKELVESCEEFKM